MNFILSLFPPNINWSVWDVILTVVALLGAILITYAVFLEVERRRDAIFMLGGMGLLVYALWIGNTVFIIAMAGLVVGSAIEFVEIVLGRHVHGVKIVEKYQDPNAKMYK